jgi:hypothetical protein
MSRKSFLEGIVLAVVIHAHSMPSSESSSPMPIPIPSSTVATFNVLHGVGGGDQCEQEKPSKHKAFGRHLPFEGV